TLERTRQAELSEDESDGITVISLSSDQKAQAWHVEKVTEGEQDIFVVTGHKIEKFARRTNFEGYENVNRLRDIMKKMGITHALNRAGAVGDSVIRIGHQTFTLLEQ